jgi:hypothetical protein
MTTEVELTIEGSDPSSPIQFRDHTDYDGAVFFKAANGRGGADSR